MGKVLDRLEFQSVFWTGRGDDLKFYHNQKAANRRK